MACLNGTRGYGKAVLKMQSRLIGLDVFEILEPIPGSPVDITPDTLNWSPLEIDIQLGNSAFQR